MGDKYQPLMCVHYSFVKARIYTGTLHMEVLYIVRFFSPNYKRFKQGQKELGLLLTSHSSTFEEVLKLLVPRYNAMKPWRELLRSM